MVKRIEITEEKRGEVLTVNHRKMLVEGDPILNNLVLIGRTAKGIEIIILGCDMFLRRTPSNNGKEYEYLTNGQPSHIYNDLKKTEGSYYDALLKKAGL